MSVQYRTTVEWDSTLIDLEFTDTMNPLVKGLVVRVLKITTGAPATTAERFMPGAIIQNAVSTIPYYNSGTTASPVWTSMLTGLQGPTGPQRVLLDTLVQQGQVQLDLLDTLVPGSYWIHWSNRIHRSLNSYSFHYSGGKRWV